MRRKRGMRADHMQCLRDLLLCLVCRVYSSAPDWSACYDHQTDPPHSCAAAFFLSHRFAAAAALCNGASCSDVSRGTRRTESVGRRLSNEPRISSNRNNTSNDSSCCCLQNWTRQKTFYHHHQL